MSTPRSKSLASPWISFPYNSSQKTRKGVLGRDLSAELIKQMYQPTIKTTNKGLRHFMCKLQLGTSRGCTRFWDESDARTAAPESYLDSAFQASVAPSHLYVMPKEIGWVVLLKDLKIKKLETACPFAPPPGPACGSEDRW